MNSSEHLISTSNMSTNRRFTRSTASMRSLSASEDEDDISIHRIVRPRSITNSNYSSSRIQREEVNEQYLYSNNGTHLENRDTNNHFSRHSGISDGDSSSYFSESSHLGRSTVQNSIFHRFRWFLWSCIYLKIINVVSFDVWLLSRLQHYGKKKLMLWLLLPLLLYILSGLFHRDSSLIEDKSQKYSIISPVYNFCSSIFSSVFGYIYKEKEDPDLDVHTASCNSQSSIIHSFFHGLSGLFGTLSGWLVRTGEKASLMTEKNQEEFVYDQKEEVVKPFLSNKEEVKLQQPSREELKILALEMFRDEVNSVKDFFKAGMQGAEITRLAKDKELQNEIKSLHLEFKRLEKEIIKQSEKSEAKEKIDAITSDYKNHVDQLNMKLKTIEAKLEYLKSCCDKQWSEADFLALLEKHLILAFKNVVDADSDTSSKYHFFNQWLNSKFYNHENLMREINAALNKHKSSHSDNTMNHDTVIKIVESTVSKHTESLKRNLSESDQFGFSTFTADMFSEDKVKRIVKEAIMLYDADKIGQVDYALESGGGSVLGTRCSETYIEKYGKLSIFGLPLWTDSNSPRTAIQPDVQPGRCWAFKGSQGFLVIELSATIYPTGFTLEHIPVSLSPSGSIDSAPKNFSVWGLDSEKDNKGRLLGEYAYEINGEPLQYFPIKKPSEKPYTYIELQIHSNHGNMEYTCLYRFRVHGKRVK